jgi:hypothetical protein
VKGILQDIVRPECHPVGYSFKVNQGFTYLWAQ